MRQEIEGAIINITPSPGAVHEDQVPVVPEYRFGEFGRHLSFGRDLGYGIAGGPES